jgi:4-alpha-glucanotransferase
MVSMTVAALLTSYRDALGTERHSPAWAVAEVRAALAAEQGDGFVDVIRTTAGGDAGALRGTTLVLEGGGELAIGDRIPSDLPVGYHLLDAGAGPVLVLHAPPRVPAPPARGWVLAAQLYAARSAQSWGHGDLRDARTLARWVADGGGDGYLMVNPLHAALPGPSPQPSPYFASTRAYRNPIYLAVDEIADVPAALLDEHGASARAANGDDQIDRARSWGHKLAVLEGTWSAAEGRLLAERVDGWLGDGTNARYARFCAERSEGLAADPRFHAWLQLLVGDQLAAVGPNLVHDVAVGTDRAGADAHLWPTCFVTEGMRIGCPPDQFNTQGQDWGLPPIHPTALRAQGYEPFVRAIRAAAGGAAGLRIDHVMALERTFWIPEAGEPADGVYVQYPLEELLDVVAIEAHRAGAFVVGEDLGTVPPSIPPALEQRGILSYRVAVIDDAHPSTLPPRTMSSVTTHDLPTCAGLLSGRDLADQQRLGLRPNVADTEAGAARLRRWCGLDEQAPVRDVVLGIHQLVAASPAALAVATLDDLAGAERRPNMPGTIDQWPNWRLGLPAPIEQIVDGDLALAVRRELAGRAGA